MQGEARLRGLERNNDSKTMSPPEARYPAELLTSGLRRRVYSLNIHTDPCSIPPPHPLAARNRHSYGNSAGAAQYTATHKAQVLSSWFSVLGSWFLVLSSQFLVLSSQFLVLSSWFSVLIPFALCGRTQRVCGTISALCCAFIHKLDGGLRSVRSSHSWH